MNWSFIICTDGRNNCHFHPYIINSIKKQNIPEYEIIFVVEDDPTNPFDVIGDKMKTIRVKTFKEAQITLKKNIGAHVAKYENLCFMHDYLFLSENWYQSFDIFGYDWNVCTSKIFSGNNRYWDWCVYKHPVLGHTKVDYDMEATKYHYAPGNFFCVKRRFFLNNLLNPELCWDEGEDIEWSRRIDEKWNYKINTLSSVHFLKIK